MMENSLKKIMHLYKWITLLYTWNIIDPLCLNKNKNYKKDSNYKL